LFLHTRTRGTQKKRTEAFESLITGKPHAHILNLLASMLKTHVVWCVEGAQTHYCIHETPSLRSGSVLVIAVMAPPRTYACLRDALLVPSDPNDGTLSGLGKKFFENFSKADLIDFAEGASVDFQGMKKDLLIDAILNKDQSVYTPPTQL
jgi:hypothetical protein